MSFTTEAIAPPPTAKALAEPRHFDLPVKDFMGYDPKGTTSITGSPLVQRAANVKQAEIVEEPVVEQQATQEESVTLSPKVSALARKEQAQRQKEVQLARREKELAEKLSKAEKFDQLQAKLAAKDYSAIEELGLSSNELASYEVEKLNALDPAEQRARKLEEQIAQIKRAQEEREVQDYQANQVLWKQEISKLVSERPEFAAIKKMNAEELVLKHVNDSFDEDGIELTAEQAAKEISDAIKERAKRFAAAIEDEKPLDAPKVMGPPKSSVKTITQTMTTTPKTSSSKPFHLMSESEQLAEGIRRVNEAKLKR